MVRQGKYTRVTPARRAKRQVRRRWRWFSELSRKKKIALIATPVLGFLVLTPLLTYAYFAQDISNQERLMNRKNTGVVLLASDGKTEVYSSGRAQHRDMVPLAQISDDMEQALIASEDKNFYEHSGFSIGSMLGALYGNVIAGNNAYGGSTLTQQLAKNTLLSSDKNFLRKFQELSISIAIERTYSKDEILEMYLNSVYYGENSFGIQDAAETYFGQSPAELDLAQSAMLVGLLPAPSAYSPISGNPEYAKERQTKVLTRMVDNKVISEVEKTAALAQQLAYQPAESSADASKAPHFAEMVLKELSDKYGEETVTRSGYQVTTTLDINLQQQLKTNVDNNIGYIQRRGGSNAGGVAIDSTSGQIRALVGSVDWNNEDWGKVNMGTTMRQPGSSFKPIYYSKALADGVITPATVLQDKAKDFGGYRPLNADRRFRGDVTVRNAISQSLNIPSVEVMQKLGVNKTIDQANRMGISSIDKNTDYGLSLALGSAEASLLQMTNAYAAFGNQGQQYDTSTIQQINNKYNKTIYKTKQTSKQVISPQGAYLMSDILSDNTARAPIFGSSLTVPNHTVAVKTGTTDDSRDAWTIGYTPRLAIGVWVGNNDNTMMASGGADMAGPIWRNTMRQALSGAPNEPFAMPPEVIERAVCYGSGALSSSPGKGTYNEKFLASALPREYCSPQEEPKPVEPTPTVDNDTDDSEEESNTPSTNGNTSPPANNSGNTGGTNGSGGTGTTPPTNGGGSTPTTPGGTGNTSPTPPGNTTPIIPRSRGSSLNP